jgi:hypothetical protein
MNDEMTVYQQTLDPFTGEQGEEEAKVRGHRGYRTVKCQPCGQEVLIGVDGTQGSPKNPLQIKLDPEPVVGGNWLVLPPPGPRRKWDEYDRKATHIKSIRRTTDEERESTLLFYNAHNCAGFRE